MTTLTCPLFRRALRACATLVCATICAFAAPLRAQGAVLGAATSTAVGLGYVALTIGSLVRLAEGSEVAAVGTTVQITTFGAAGRSTLRGELTATDDDSLTIVVGSVPRRVARADVRQMSAYRGREQKWAQGYGIGFLTGAAAGAVGGLASGNDPPSEWFSFTAKQKGMILGVAGGIFGSAVGSLIGLAVQGEHWKSIDRLPSGTTVIVTPAGSGGYALGLRIPF